MRVLYASLLSLLCAVALGACGSSSSGNATQLLQQTFGGSHKITSGNVSFTITVDPSGSSILTTPITLSLGGPFQSLGPGKLPQSNFNLSLSGLGKSGSIGLVSTGTAGYVTLKGAAYQLPQAIFQKLESSFSQLASTPGGSSGGTLGRLGIHPLHWLKDASVVGNETVAGAETTHIQAGINVPALLDDLSTFLQKASSLGVTGTSGLSGGLSASTKSKIARAIHNPRLDVWTGAGDKTLRRLQIQLTVPVSGQISTLLGGLRSAAIGVVIQYADINKPQSISAPGNVRPFSEFAAKVKTFVQSIQSGLGALSGSSGTSTAPSGTSTAPSGPPGAGSAASAQAYSQCITNAGTDVTKMQQCASLLNGQ